MSSHMRWAFTCQAPNEPACHGCDEGWSVEHCHPDQPGAYPTQAFKDTWPDAAP